MVMLSVNGLVKRYAGTLDEKAAVRGISFEVEQGEFFTLLGPSGCGKTTTLRAVAGLETPDAGTIEINQQVVFSAADRTAVPAHRRPLSMVFQSYAVWPHLSVLKNVMYPLRAAHMPRPAAKKQAQEALEIVGLADVADRMPGALSGGQQQRVALARAVVRNSKLLLLDEPLSNLDAKLRVQMREEIKSLQQLLGAAVLYVTHDQEEAMMLSDRIAVINSGVVVEMGEPAQLYSAPEQLFTARFMGENNLIPVSLDEVVAPGAVVSADFGRVRTSHYYPGDGSEQTHYLLLRPESLGLERDTTRDSDEQNEFRGTITSATYLGKIREYRVAVGSTELTVQRIGEAPIPVGEKVRLIISPENSAVYVSAAGLANTDARRAKNKQVLATVGGEE